ncbi:MAG: 7-cyano-7-deazaguanine synthase [bacterium]|nr:7-cyano-7-deazaguanine synthase [bacterium]
MTDSLQSVDPDRLWDLLKFDESEIHGLNTKRAIVVFSGGFDSTVALWWAMDRYKDVSAIILDYNQAHGEELLSAKAIASLAGVKTRLVKLDLPQDFWAINNGITRGQAGLMTSIAALDVGFEGADIVHGILRTDTYPDCTREHLDYLAGIIKDSRDVGPLGIATPLRAVKDKQAVCLLGFLYGAPMKWTWSCRQPKDGKPCGACSPCKARAEIWDGFEEWHRVSRETIDEWQDVLGSPAHPSFKEPPRELEVLARAFIEMDGLEHGEPGWRYRGPDGAERIATWVRNPDAIDFAGRSSGEPCKNVEIHGELEDGSRWQVVICEDGSVAFTNKLPNMAVIEESLKSKLVGLKFGDQ